MDLRKTIITIGALLTCTLVYADPITTFLSTALITSSAGAVILTVGNVLFAAGSLLFGSAQQRKLKKKALAEQRRQKDEYNAGLSDRTVNGIGSEFPARHVYGTARIGGNIVDIITSGVRDEFQHLIVLGTQHQIDDFAEVYINGKAVGALDVDGYAINAPFGKTVTSNETAQIAAGSNSIVLPYTPDANSVIVTVYISDAEQISYTPIAFSLTGLTVNSDPAFASSVKYISYTRQKQDSPIRITKHLGVPGGSYDLNTHVETGGKLKTTSVFSGHSYLAIRLLLDEPEFQNLPAIEMLVKRDSLYDIRTGTVVSTSGTNNALVAYDYLTGPLCELEDIVLPTAQYITAANDCDVIVNNGDGDRKRYTFNGVISSDQSREEVLQRIADSMAGGIVATTWDIYAGVYRAPVMSLNESDIVGSLSVTPGASELEIFNTVYGRFASAENAWLEKDYRKYTQSTYLAADGGELEVGITYPYTVTQTEVDQLNRIATEQARNDFTINAMFSLKAWKLKVGDRVFWTSPFMGQTNETYRVVDRSSGSGVGVSLMLKQDTAAMYDLYDAVTLPSVPVSTLPNPWLMPPPTDVVAFSGTSTLTYQGEGSLSAGIRVSWYLAPTTNPPRGSVIDVEAERLTGIGLPDILSVQAPTDTRTIVISGVQEQETYRIRVRTRNTFTAAQSEWVYTLPHVARGKTDPPSAVTEVSLSQDFVFWKPVTDLDVLYGGGYQLRVATGASGPNVNWARATVINTGTVTDAPYRLPVRLYGVQTIFVAAVDSSGNIGAAGQATLDFGAVPTNGVAEQYDYQANAWPGIISGGATSFGTISADGAVSSSVYDLLDIYSEPDVYSTYWNDLVYETSIFTAQYGGTTITLESNATGNGVTVEYRRLEDNDVYTLTDVYASTTTYGTLSAWQPWPGSLPVTKYTAIQWRVSITGGSQRGQINTFTVYAIATRRGQSFFNIALASGGTRLTPSSGDPSLTWIPGGIRTVQVTLIGTDAIGTRVLDFDTVTGPLVQAINASGTGVSSNATIYLEGLIDA